MVIEQFLTWMNSAPVPERTRAVSALARAYLHSEMTFEERLASESAMTVLLEDSSATVRYALADALAQSKNAPRHIMMGLATDTKEIAALVLTRSPVFSDGELVDLVASGTVEQQIAIACRGEISFALCGAIAEVGVAEACQGLLMNEAAHCSAKIMRRIGERHGDNGEIRNIMLADENLDADIRLMLLEKLGNRLGEFVTSRNWLPKARANGSIRDALDTSSIVHASSCEGDQLERLVDALISSKRLTTAYLLRAICMGNITLFCKSLSRLSAIPTPRIEAMISQRRHSAFRAAFVKGGMPVEAFEVFSTALNVWQELLSEPEWISRARMPYLVTRQLVAKMQGSRSGVVDELLLLLQKISSQMARDDAKHHVLELARKRAEKQAAQCSAAMQNMIASNEGEEGTSGAQTGDSQADIELLDQEFLHNMEASLAQTLEQEIIEISDKDISVPQRAANDSAIARDEAQTVEPVIVSLLSNAA